MIAGPAILKQNNGLPIGLTGEWSVTSSVPIFRSYGQGDGSPASGYNGSAKGTAQNVSGSFRFVVDPSGEITAAQLYTLQRSREMFTMDWPVGDPLASTVKAKATDCHWDSLTVNVDPTSGKMEISGSMSAGTLEITSAASA
jgi:hypothetical protein